MAAEGVLGDHQQVHRPGELHRPVPDLVADLLVVAVGLEHVLVPVVGEDHPLVQDRVVDHKLVVIRPVLHQEQDLALFQRQEDFPVLRTCEGQLLLRQEYCHLGNQVSGEIPGGIRWSEVMCQVKPHLVAPLPEILVCQHEAHRAELSVEPVRHGHVHPIDHHEPAGRRLPGLGSGM